MKRFSWQCSDLPHIIWLFENLSNGHSHQLIWQKIPQWQIERSRIQDELRPSEIPSGKEGFVRMYEDYKKFLLRKPMYIPIIEEITRNLKPQLKSFTSKQSLKGTITNGTFKQGIEIQFQENLQGSFTSKSERLELGRDLHGFTFFCDKINSEFPFSIQFSFFPKQQVADMLAGTNGAGPFVQFKGSFRTFVIDYKRVK